MMKSVDEYALEIFLKFVLFSQDSIELRGPEILCYWRIRLHPDPLCVFPVVPMSGLQYRVVPELLSEHLLEQGDHRPQGIGHSVVSLFEGDDEDMDVFDFVPEGGHQVLDGLLLLDQLVPEARSVDDGEPLPRGVAQPVALVSAGPLGDAVQSSAHFKTSIVEAPPVVVLVPADQDVGQAGLADTGGPENDDPGTGVLVLVVVEWEGA